MKRPNRSSLSSSGSLGKGAFSSMDSPLSAAASSLTYPSTNNRQRVKNGIASLNDLNSEVSLLDLTGKPSRGGGVKPADEVEESDGINYALLIALYTIQGIPMGLSASIPFLIQQKVAAMAKIASASATTASAAAGVASNASPQSSQLTTMAYNAQAIFALCSWPFSLKLFWAPIVDAVYSSRFGRRKSWLIPVQAMAGAMMIWGSDYVENQLGLSSSEGLIESSFNVKGVTAFFFILYFLMATQDIAVDGWALTMLKKVNRGKGPVCNSIGQNLGYFFSFVGFLALNDPESSENLWRPLFGLQSKPGVGLVSLGGFIRFMGICTIVVTTFIAIFKRENDSADDADDEPAELDASEIGIQETYKRLFALCKLPAVQTLFLILLTYRLPTALSDNVKFLKAVEFGLSKQTTALLSPTIILPLGIAVPIIASKIWQGHPLRQFLAAYKFRVAVVPIFDICMLLMVRSVKGQMEQDLSSGMQMLFWVLLIGSTAFQTIVHTLQFNAQMTFFASRVDPAIGGSYMTLLNTAANLGGTWPASIVMFLMGKFSVPATCEISPVTGEEICQKGRDAYFPLQIAFSLLGMLWLLFMSKKVEHVANLSESSWRTGIGEDKDASKHA